MAKKSAGRGGYREGSGRKPTGEPVKKPRTVRAYDRNWQAYRDAADAAGLSLQEWIDNQLNAAAGIAD